MNRVLWIAAGAVAALIGIVVAFAYLQASNERVDLMSDLQYRTRVVADSLEEAIAPSMRQQATSTVQRIITRIAGNERIAGIAVFNSIGDAVAQEKDLPSGTNVVDMIKTVMDSAKPSGLLVSGGEGTMYAYVTPLYDSQSSVIGALMVVQNAAYINETIGQIWWRTAQRIFVLTFLILATIFGLVYFAFRRPILRMSETLQAIRRGDAPEAAIAADGFFAPLAHEIAKMTTSLHQARTSASEEARMRLEKLDSPWTAERLKEFIKVHAKSRPIYVLSNREPYEHHRVKKGIECSVPAHGMVTAVDALMQACGGVWIATGSGDADRETADADGKIAVPPDEPHYTLKRIWLDDEEIRGHYVGFSNEALFPLCLMTHVRPVFRPTDWQMYRRVNAKFAQALLAEIRHIEQPLILVQDLHFALVPALIKKSRPDAQVALFWHHPWPSAEQFSICPWRKEILEGMLGADLLGFHIQQHCNNFMETAGKEVEAIIDFERFAITKNGHTSIVRSFPISVPFAGVAGSSGRMGGGASPFVAYGVHTPYVALGVDRLDYTKGIIERFRGIEQFFKAHPGYRKQVTFVQIAAPSREAVQKYREYAQEVQREVQRINAALQTDTWKPIVFVHRHLSHEELRPLYRNAHICLVTSLHDGMNLVAKEFIAEREQTGVLILSSFTGAARELTSALIVNPYSPEEIADALHRALTMPASEQYRRMKSLHTVVSDYNVYRWAMELIKSLTRTAAS